MGVKVSVVVPVLNPRPMDDAFDACVRSLLEQSMPPESYEVIFADDGSVDGTRERLDAVSAVRPNIRVLHLDHSGTPTRGRNVGLAVARGAYVYLMNQGDRLERTALEHMLDMALATDADVLVGRLVEDGGPPLTVFAQDRPRADVLRDRLLTLPTAHKLYRREFVQAARLRFGEGALAEQVFVTKAYLAAKVVAVQAGRVACHVMPLPEEEPGGAALAEGLRELFDAVEAHTEPGEQRDRIQAHWFRALGLRRVGGRRFESATPEQRAALVDRLRVFAAERFPRENDLYLPVHLRARAALLRAGRLEDLLDLAGATRGIRLQSALTDVRWDGTILTMDLSAQIVRGDGGPLWFRFEGGRLMWDPPVDLGPVLRRPEADITSAVDKVKMEVYVRHTDTGVTYFLPVSSEIKRSLDGRRMRLWAAGQARLDIGSAALGMPLPPGMWEVHVRMRGVHPGRCRVGRATAPGSVAGVLADIPRRLVVPYFTGKGELSVCVEPRSFPESIALVSAATTVVRRDGHLLVAVPVPYVPPSGGPAVELVLRQAGGRRRTVVVPALVEPGVPGRMAGQLVAKVPIRRLSGEGRLSPGVWRPRLRMAEREVDLRFTLWVGRGGRAEIVSGPQPAPRTSSPLRRLRALGGSLATSLSERSSLRRAGSRPR
ncbi:glycosyltransferase [Streptosporangiaceae bacterium NEAU-GS5]|nr:glycosyltransferase [Streptosporangiaceae bacterium NEAU-GS5]